MKIVVDMNRCEANGLCELSSPEVFQLENDGTLHYEVEPDPEHHDDVIEAIGACPTQAISLLEE